MEAQAKAKWRAKRISTISLRGILPRFGAALEQVNDDPKPVSATKTTTWIKFATGS